jgi:hypothetical protein
MNVIFTSALRKMFRGSLGFSGFPKARFLCNKTLKAQSTLQQDMKAERVRRVIFSFTLSLTSALDGVGGQPHAPAAITPGEETRTHCTGCYMGLGGGLDECGILAPTGI